LNYNNRNWGVFYVVRVEIGRFEATNSVLGYAPDSHDVSTEAEISVVENCYQATTRKDYKRLEKN
jgi:hypothetical protein